MSKVHDALDQGLTKFIEAQPIFFVATAPSGDGGHVNLSPKGLKDTLRVLGPREVAYLDLTGSGVETIAHLRQNGRITIMLCAFEGAPRIVRIYGKGEALVAGSEAYRSLVERFPAHPGARSIIRVAIERVSSSCGYAVPRLAHAGERSQLDEWAEKKGEDGIARYRREHNARSIDELPGID